ncbi:MAG TPA: cytochrome c [Cyclobacteriaceae bacterium]|nr:cytochrome c [Cyclobacteriaceae bacterium]
MKSNFSRSNIVALFALVEFFLAGCVTNSNQSAKFQQYYVQGEQLYLQHCGNCHQKNGSGLGLLYPPLNTSDFMDNHVEESICLIKNGASGEMIVNQKQFNHEMPTLPLTELEVAEISTYIYNSWGRQHEIIEVQQVETALSKCKK